MNNSFILSFLFLLSLSAPGFTQSPGLFNYQAVIRNTDGSGVVNENIDLRFQLFNASTLGQQIFEEEFLDIHTGPFGVINLQIGKLGNVDLSTLKWGEENYFVNIQMRQGITPYADISNNRTQLVSVPYALYAHKADTAAYAFSTSGSGGSGDGNLINAIFITDTLILTVSNGIGGQNSFRVPLPNEGDKWGNQVIVHDRTLKGSGITNDSLSLADMGATQGQVLKWINGKWQPDSDLSSGTVTADNISIEGNGTTGNTLRIKNSGVTNAKVAPNAITSDKIANGDVTSEDLSDMDAAEGDVLTYGSGGWNPQPPASGGNSYWTKEGDNLFVNDGELVGIGTNSPSANLTVLGEIGLENQFGNALRLNAEAYGPSGNIIIQNHPPFGAPYQSIEIIGGGGGSVDVGPGINMYGPDGTVLVSPTNIVQYLDNAYVESSFHITGSGGGSGYVSNHGANGSVNARMTNLLGYPNNGFLAVHDEFGTSQAGVYVSELGEGVIYADVKNFRMDHPRDHTKEIWYASLEGPEAGAYERGTGSLQQGETFIPFSEHFQLVINPETITVSLTPLSSETYGLAVIEKSEFGIKVKELKGGTGNFKFDWEVKGVRKGYEDYQPIRMKGSATPE